MDLRDEYIAYSDSYEVHKYISPDPRLLPPCLPLQSCVDQAHSIASLKAGWDSIKALADIVPLNTVAEAK